jgi:YD repeat-containing protein
VDRVGLAADEVARRVRLANGAERREICSLAGRLRRIEEPDGSSLRFRYRADGSLAEVIHSSGEKASYGRDDDPVGRVLLDPPSSPGVGGSKKTRPTRISSVCAGTETIIELNEHGLPESLVQRIDGFEWTVSYSHDDQARVTGILYPQSAEWLRIRPTPARPGTVSTTIEYDGRVLAVARFDATERLTQIRCGNDTVITEDLGTHDAPGLRRITHQDAAGQSCSDTEYAHDAAGLITRAGADEFEYDAQGRLTRGGGQSYEFDAEGRCASIGDEPLLYEGPVVSGLGTRCEFRYDVLGRRVLRRDATGETHYRYNLYGQLDRVTLPDGETIRYRYDGFGRLVARQTASGTRYFIVGFDGHRLAEADVDGRITLRYLWLAQNCLAAFDAEGVTTYHRVHGGRLVAIGDTTGALSAVLPGNPYGVGSLIDESVPGFGSLFGDSQTGLLFAGSRWFDPESAQFLTADSWFGTDAWNHLPGGMRQVLDSLPGGTDMSESPGAAYNWCGFDPVNRSDPNGHNPLGMVWSILSAFFWQMQVTSVALQMEVINIIVNILLLPFSFAYWDFYKKISIFNAIPPLLASSRLMVPFAFPLNGIFNASGSVFTMGAVIWANGNQIRKLEETSQRDLLVCPNAQEYLAATATASADTLRTRHPDSKATATVDATGANLNGVTMAAAVNTIPVQEAFQPRDWIAIRVPGGEDQFRQIDSVVGPSIALKPDLPPLPTALQGQNVELQRLDASIVRIEKDRKSIARSVTFVRGQAIHYRAQIPEAIPATGVNVTEYVPAVRRDVRNVVATPEAILVRLADAAHANDFAANDFVRIRKGSTHTGRQVARKHGAADLMLDSPLPPLVAPAAYDPIEIVKMDGGATANNQTASGDRVDCGTLTDLRKFDGLEIAGGGTTDRRIVAALFVRCPVTALPNALHGVDLTTEVVIPGVQVQGTVATATTITAATGQAANLQVNRPVRVRTGPSTDFLSVVQNISGDTITLADSLPAAFPATTAVSVTLLTMFKRFEADQSPAPGDRVVVPVEDPASPQQNDILFVLPRGSSTGGAVRQINAATTVVAKVDSAPTTAANLTVRRFVPVTATAHGDAKAPLVQARLTLAGASPFAANDELYLSNGEEAYGKVLSVAGNVIVLEDPIEIPGLSTTPVAFRLAPTGHTTVNAQLDESLIMIPAVPGEELVTRRRSLELHEMRHVWQYAVMGPFFFSLPIPWLFHLGFSFGGDGAGHASHNLTKWISLGIVDKLFAAIAWGVGALFGAEPSSGSASGAVGGDRKSVVFDAGTTEQALDAFTEGSPVELAPAEGSTLFNIVEGLDKPSRQLRVRFEIGDGLTPGARVTAAVSAFDKIDSTVNKWFSLNLERLWSDHIPSAWGRALSGLLNRENWFPPLGLYPLALAMAGFKQDRVTFEQDASFQSGDLYTPFTVSEPNEVFVGQFSRVHAFVYSRLLNAAGEEIGAGLSDTDVSSALTVETPVVAGRTPEDLVAGSLPVSGFPDRVRLRENWQIPLNDKASNVIGGLFAASADGDYVLHTPGELDRVQRMLFFSSDFFDLKTVKVKPLAVTPAVSPVNPLFETERAAFAIVGDPAATYGLRYKGIPPAPAGSINGVEFIAPVLPSNAAVEHNLEIAATYPPTAAVFQGKGQAGAVRLTAAQRTNACQPLKFNVNPIVVADITPVRAGDTRTFEVPFAPASITVTSAKPPEAAVNASVQNGTGRPARLTFRAPDHVNADTTVTFDMVFGSGANTKTITKSVLVTGQPLATEDYLDWSPSRTEERRGGKKGPRK